MRSVDVYSLYIVYLTVPEVTFFRAIRRTHGTSPRDPSSSHRGNGSDGRSFSLLNHMEGEAAALREGSELAPAGRSYALVIGINEYDDEKLEDLTGARRDAGRI